MIELNAAFWAVTALATVLLSLAPAPTFRNTVQAAVNLLFIATLLGRLSVGIVAALAVSCVTVNAIGRTRQQQAWLSALAAVGVLVAVFIIHKEPHLGADSRWAAVTPVLAAIGYSYVMLRMIDMISAVADRQTPAPDFVSLVNYLLPFHMLAAGPIESYTEFWAQRPTTTPLTSAHALAAVERITRGLTKKFVIAFILQRVFLTDFTAGGGYFLLELQVFFLWLYLDFSAYSDIAAGIGALLGITTPENFNRPLLSRNMIQFWERWHISLSMFVRRRLFIPLQMFLMRKTDAKYPLLCAIAATSLAFLVTGLWHGLTVGFLIWGAAQGLGVIITRLYASALQKRIGARGVRAYLANPWVHAAAVVLTLSLKQPPS